MIRLQLGRVFEVTFGRPRGVLRRTGAVVMVRANAAQAAGIGNVWTSMQARRRSGPAVEVTARTPG